MTTVEQWSAEQCGVEPITITTYSGFIDCSVEGFICNDIEYPFGWSVKDPRCREIVREHFKINTVWIEKGKWRATENKWRNDESGCIYMEGEDPEEAECNCIEAIHEAEK